MRTRWMAAMLGMALALAAGQAVGTAQAPDELVVDGKTYPLNTNPLAGWLAAHPERTLPEGVVSTGDWRGYTAEWEIRGGALWLRKVQKLHTRQFPSNEPKPITPAPDPARCVVEDWYWRCNWIRDLFPGDGEVRADWYTGTLIVPTGEMLDYVHMGYGSTYSRYLVVWVRKGQVLRQLELDDRQFTELRRERFKAFQKTEEYRKQYAESKKTLGKDAEDFLYQFHAEEYLSLDPEAAP